MISTQPLLLAGPWRLDAGGDHACTMAMPGDGISALFDAGLIPDPYWGRNEYDLRWICERDWVAGRSFMLTDTDVDMVLSEIDTVATIRVNGQVVLSCQNAFRRYRVPLGGVAKVGENKIEITFHSPVVAGKALSDAHPFQIPWSDNCPIPYGNFLRKPACDFGWDWNIALAPFGIYGAMHIEPTAAARVDAVLCEQHFPDTGGVDLTVRVWASHTRTAPIVHFDGQPLNLQTTANDDHIFQIHIKDPNLWWPTGYGSQCLYDLTVALDGTIHHCKIGLRDLKLITEPDDAGLGFKFRCNGTDIFCKGANWIPADALPGRITGAKTRALLQSAVDANMNMVRIWGGGRYEPDSFYEACDELGLLVWQDFMFACNLYPSDEAFLSEVRAEVADNVTRLQHHACIAVWCGDNELVGALTWYDVSQKDRDRYLVNYDRLNRCIETALHDTDPSAVWWPSSPSAGPMNFGDAWHDDGSGDMHFWSVWHEGRDFDHYRDVAPRFCSEFGFQSYPSMDVIDQFAGPADQNIAAPVLESHQKNVGGNARIAETMFRYFRWPPKFANFVYLSQIQQGLAIKTAVSHWRASKPRCMGTLIWQLNDTWPVCSWSSLDYGGGWKLMHHMARRFYAPVSVTAVPSGDQITLRAMNDTRNPVSLTVTAEAVAMTGNTRALGQATLTVGTDATDALTLAARDITSTEMLLLTWTGEDGHNGQDLHAPQPFKSYDLLAPHIEIQAHQSGSDWTITLTAQTLALFTSVEANTPGQFSDNAFALLPGAPKTLRFTPADPTQTPIFTLRDLHSATYD